MTQGQYFDQSLTGLNSEFSFSCIDSHTEVKEPKSGLLFHWKEDNWIHTFPNNISADNLV